MSKPIEVAVIGGGCAGIAAAFELSRPEHRGRYHVTVYQLGWRLGGKGASGRGPADRIEEHGLHVWMGFYENAFRLMRECYAELDRDPAACRIATWRDAFEPAPYVALTEPSGDGGWRLWNAAFPPEPGDPGDPLREKNPFSMASYLRRCVTLLRALLIAAGEKEAPPDRGAAPFLSPEALLDSISRMLRYGQIATLTGLVEACRLLEGALGTVVMAPDNLLLRLIDAVAAGMRRFLDSLVESDVEARRIWELADLVLAGLRGAVRFGLLVHPKGFDAIEDYDLTEWLRLNGASEAALGSPFLRSAYDLTFAYEDGDPRRPRLAAGLALRGTLRMYFTYRGSLFWKMTSGMGDVVFAPFYEVLRRRGVSFRFFHRLENVRLAHPSKLRPGERPYVEALELDIQAETAGGGEYEPLIDVRGLPCWSSSPDWSQLVDGDRMRAEDWRFESFWDRRKVGRRTLRVVEDFDFVVLAVSLGVIPHTCREILARDRRWRDMVRHVKTVETQAFQLWLRKDARQLGWRGGPHATLCGFVEPFDTWADMQQLLREESWPEPPRSIAYFCNVLPTPRAAPDRSQADYPERRRAEVRDNAIRFLDRDMGHLWPRAVGRGGFRWDLLIHPDGRSGDPGRHRFESQYWTANVNPSDRYVQSLPGSSRYRLSPLDNTYDNLTIAGDWTEAGHSSGCVESAVMSGRLAAHALSGRPALEEIIGYDHP